jgi:DNA polymerase
MVKPVIKEGERDEALKAIRNELLDLKLSPLYEYRKSNGYFPVAGQGNHYARIMFIGEAPGRNEAQTGRPFCGVAGKLLDQLLDSIGMKRDDVYITNIVKDRPPENRDPLPEEIKIYAPFLNSQINIIQPEVITTLGRFSMEYIMKKYGLESQLKSISQMHGQIFKSNPLIGQTITIIPLYHPAAAIYNQKLKKTLFEDFKALEQFK